MVNRFVKGAAVLCALLACVACDKLLGNIRNPAQQVDIVAIKTQLVLIAKAEQRYQVTNSRFGTIEQLLKEELLLGAPDRNGYTFTSEAGIDTFTVIAVQSDPKKTGWPTLSIDEKMQVISKGGDGSGDKDVEKGLEKLPDIPVPDTSLEKGALEKEIEKSLQKEKDALKPAP